MYPCCALLQNNLYCKQFLSMNNAEPKSFRNICNQICGKVIAATSSVAAMVVGEQFTPGVGATHADSLDRGDYEKAVVNFPSDDFWYPPFMLGKWNMSMTFLGGSFTDKVPIERLAADNNLPGFSPYSVGFIPRMGKDVSNVTMRYVQLDSHPREDHPFNIRSLFSAFVPEATIDSAAYNFRKAPNFIYSPSNKWDIKYHDPNGEGLIELRTRKRSIRVFAGTVETIEFFTQTHKKRPKSGSDKEVVTTGDYAMNWKLSVPASQKDEFITVLDLSKSPIIIGTLDVLTFFQPTNDLYLKLPKEAAGVFSYNITMMRIGTEAESTTNTEYPFVWQDAGPVELGQYFGY